MGFFLSENNLEGTIPECFRNLSSSLLQFDLEDNNFHGQIPQIFAKGCMLKSLRINKNELEGSIPQSLSNCEDLILLDVGNNNLNDTFPNWLGNLDQLQVLILRSNRFYGQVDSFDVTVSLTHLRIIDLSHNNFSGYIRTFFFEHLHAIREGYEKKVEPKYMEDVIGDITVNYASDLSITAKGLETEFQELLSIWTIIDLSSNQFSGEIPKILGELHLLIVLNLSHNCLIGPIPSSLGNLSELESLDLSSNKLEGRIPTELRNLGFLEVLNLSQNNLKGPIPQGKQFDTFANDSYMGNLDLCGLPLSKSCDTEEETPAIFDSDGDGDGEELNWKFSIVMGYGCGLVLGISMAYIVFTIGKPWWLIRIIEREKLTLRRVQQLANRTKNIIAWWASLMAMFPDVFMIGALGFKTLPRRRHRGFLKPPGPPLSTRIKTTRIQISVGAGDGMGAGGGSRLGGGVPSMRRPRVSLGQKFWFFFLGLGLELVLAHLLLG
ncbi:hypothetical protein [Gossypium barbadense]|uniref:Leucine-rich repeat-containing N-terminal plant-type domain-containing protein n=2 Tax=Gossypium TaxID=3633 RepID=A0A5J5NA10_GOSBA|nr:hypothetical protein ES319_1Z057400v1 [Gossypium barbadense]KAB1671295.1 hypothetical protein [Gossypium barbadense]